MTQYVNLPVNHPCNFNVLQKMASIDGEQCKPAVVCVFSERQWNLWRHILENKDIASFINKEFLFWVQPSMSIDGTQALATLNGSNSLGMLAITFSVGDRRKIVKMLSGPPPTVSELKKILQEALKQFKEEKLKCKEVVRMRALKLQQDMEYQASLEADRAKEKLKRNTKETQTENFIERLPEAPEAQNIQMADDAPPTKRLRSDTSVRFIIVLPCGTRRQIDIQKSSKLEELHQEVRTLLPVDAPGVSLQYMVDANVTRSIPNEAKISVEQFKLPNNSVIRVISIDSNEDSSKEHL